MKKYFVLLVLMLCAGIPFLLVGCKDGGTDKDTNNNTTVDTVSGETKGEEEEIAFYTEYITEGQNAYFTLSCE